MAAENKARHAENFIRINGLVVDVGTEVLRDVLHSEIPPDQLSTVLKYVRNERSIDEFKKFKVITDAQYKLLSKTDPDAKEFDITLLIVVIRTICTNIEAPSGGWGVKPELIQDNHHSLGDEILRLKGIRNSIIAHTPSMHMPTEKFKELWEKISDIIRRIAKKTPNQTQAKLDYVNTRISEVWDMKVDVAGEREIRWREEMREGLLEELEDFKRDVEELVILLGIQEPPTDLASAISMMMNVLSRAKQELPNIIRLTMQMAGRYRMIMQRDDDREALLVAASKITDLTSVIKAIHQWLKSLEPRKRQIQYFAYDAYIFYAKEDAEACRESNRRLQALSQVPSLKIALYEDLHLEDLTKEKRIKYISENCPRLLFYVTSSLTADTMEKLETEMCLSAVIKEQTSRVIPLWTKPKDDMHAIPSAIDSLLGLQLWLLNGNEDEQKNVISKFDATIISGRRQIQ